MSRDHTLFYASLVGGSLAATKGGPTHLGQQFAVTAPDHLVSPLTMILSKDEAAQWARVLLDFVEVAA